MKKFWEFAGRWVFFSALLRERVLVLVFSVIGAVYLGFSLFEIPLWRCPLRVATGVRCLGCGLTTGSKALLRGRPVEAVSWNWFSPLVVLALIVIPVVMALPRAQRKRAVELIERLEKRFRLVLLLGVLAVFQVGARLLGWA